MTDWTQDGKWWLASGGRDASVFQVGDRCYRWFASRLDGYERTLDDAQRRAQYAMDHWS